MANPKKPRTEPDKKRSKPKPIDRRLTSLDPASVPNPPPGLLKVSRDMWSAFWQSDLGRAASTVTDLPVVTRLFTLYDERERAYRAVRKEGRLVEGSQGQPVMNPLLRQMSTFDVEIRNLEDRMGMSPKARLMLGIQLGAAKKTLDDLNREVARGDDDAGPVIDVGEAKEGRAQ